MKKFDDPLEPRQVVVDPTIYNAFVCEYQLAPKMILTIKKDGNRLIAQITGQKSAEIYPASGTEYFYRVTEAKVTFQRNDKGHVTGLVVTQAGYTLTASKIK